VWVACFPQMPRRPSLPEIFLVALRLGCTSFGGPVAHLAYFRKEYVEQRRWLDEARFTDLVALCQFLPGPASSQTGFAVGYLQRGFAGGLVAWLGFTLPSAGLMIAFAYGVASLGDLSAAGWLGGIKAAAVGVVAHAVWAMWRSLCPDFLRSAVAGMSAGLLFLLPQTWSQVGVIAVGGLIGWWLLPAPDRQAQTGPFTGSKRTGAVMLMIFLLLLMGLPAIVRVTNLPLLAVADTFYRVGALVFGGGHVILPLLEREVVSPGWLTHDQFLAGYGAAQALPGPLFTFSAFLGAAMTCGPGGWPGGLWAVAMIFLPALLLVAGTLPFWQDLRHQPAAQSAMRGANAAVVGLLLAALIHPVGTAGITSPATGGISLAALAALFSGRIPVWAIVGLAAGAGAWLA
jgi:chromate transporter